MTMESTEWPEGNKFIYVPTLEYDNEAGIARSLACVHGATRREQEGVREHAFETGARVPPPPRVVQVGEQLVEAVAEEVAVVL